MGDNSSSFTIARRSCLNLVLILRMNCSKKLFGIRIKSLQLTTDANDSISRVSRMTRAVKGSFGVGAVGIGVTVVGEMKILF